MSTSPAPLKDARRWVPPNYSATTERVVRVQTRMPVRRLLIDSSASSSTSIRIPTAANTLAPVVKSFPPEQKRFSLSTLSPKGRLKYLARHQPFEFVATVVSLPGAIYLIMRALFQLFPAISAFFSWQAMAQTEAAHSFIAGSGRDAFDWYVGGLMGLCLLAAVAATLFAQNEAKISFGKDMTKMIVGFTIGFLSGGKVK